MSSSWVYRTLVLLAPVLMTASFDPLNSAVQPVKELEVKGGLGTILQTKGDFRALANPIPGFATPAKPVPSSSGCIGGATQARVTVTALLNSNKIDHKGDYRSKKTSHSYVLARIDVTDCNFEEYGIEAGHRAYWVVEPDPNQLLMRTHIVDVGLTADQNKPESDLPAEKEYAKNQHFSFSECPQRHSLGYDGSLVATRADVCTTHDNLSQAALDRLGEAVGLHPPVKRDTIRAGGHIIAKVLPVTFRARAQRPAYAADDPLLWIVCSDGCCYADALR